MLNERNKYTLELRHLVEDLQENIFNFTYDRDEQARLILPDDKLQEDFIKHFYFREIGLETIDRFKFYLELRWKESIANFDKVLLAYSEPIEAKSNNGVESVSISNDTPKNALDFGEQSNHASFILNNKSKGKIGATDVDLLNNFRKNLVNVEVAFFNDLDDLFMQVF